MNQGLTGSGLKVNYKLTRNELGLNLEWAKHELEVN
jgi:hypothetical protein